LISIALFELAGKWTAVISWVEPDAVTIFIVFAIEPFGYRNSLVVKSRITADLVNALLGLFWHNRDSLLGKSNKTI
jgi:hypothetical protein